jgi:hypothetical protein
MLTAIVDSLYPRGGIAILALWEIMSGIWLIATAGTISYLGKSPQGVGVPVNKLAMMCFAAVPGSAAGFGIWMLGFYRSAILWLAVLGTAFMLSGRGLWLGRHWARESATTLAVINSILLLALVVVVNRWTLQSLVQVRVAAALWAALFIFVNGTAIWYIAILKE